MYRVAVIGDADTVLGYRGLGMKAVVTQDPAEAERLLATLAEQDYGVIYITEPLVAARPELLEPYREALLPAVIQIPSCLGGSGSAALRLRECVKRAVGMDLLAAESLENGEEA